MMRKLYCYVDESGQDTKGYLFVVSIVITEDNRENILDELNSIEQESGKGRVKWHSARPQYRERYMKALSQSSILRNKSFFDTFTNSDQYIEMTSYATAKAIAKKSSTAADYRVSIYIDGFRQKEIHRFSKGLRALNIRRRKVVGVKRDENNSIIRLADAICGLVRDAEDGQPWAKNMLATLVKKKIAQAL